MSYKYILFDIDNTLIDFRKSFDLAAKSTLKIGGVEAPTQVDVERYFAINDAAWFGLELDQSDREDICRFYHEGYEQYLLMTHVNLKKEFDLFPDAAELDAHFRRELGRQAVLNPNILDVLQTLFARAEADATAPRLAVATNGLHDLQMGKLVHFEGLFDEIFISEDLDFVKPEKEYFLAIAKKLHCEPQELLMVGDSLLNDIGGANGAGLDSCYYNPWANPDHAGVKPTYEIHDFLELLEVLKG